MAQTHVLRKWQNTEKATTTGFWNKNSTETKNTICYNIYNKLTMPVFFNK